MFNNLLLTKLSWRMLKAPSTMVSRILTNKYCHNSTFMDCSLPSNPSHGWRGIMEGTKVLSEGLGWLVGSGKEINVWIEPWLSFEVSTRPMGPPMEANQQLKVVDLIHQSPHQWNWSEVRKHIPHHEHQLKVLSLGSNNRNDSMVWLPVKNGKYSIKTRYTKAHMLPEATSLDQFNWQRNVWRVKTTPKI